jgi:hypothetical protein
MQGIPVTIHWNQSPADCVNANSSDQGRIDFAFRKNTLYRLTNSVPPNISVNFSP